MTLYQSIPSTNPSSLFSKPKAYIAYTSFSFASLDYRGWEDLHPFLVDGETGCQVQDAAIGCALGHSSAFLGTLKIF